MGRKYKCNILIDKVYDTIASNECVGDVLLPLCFTKCYHTIDFVAGQGQIVGANIDYTIEENCKSKGIIEYTINVPLALEFVADGERIGINSFFISKERHAIKIPDKSVAKPYINCTASILVPSGEVIANHSLSCSMLYSKMVCLVGKSSILVDAYE